MNQRFGEYFLRALFVFGIWTTIAFVTGIGW